jgi:hypothetical protein
LPALQSTPNSGSGVSIVAITPRTPRSTTTTSTTTIGIASTERPLFNVNTIFHNVIDDSRELKEENRSQQINRQKQPTSVRVRQRKVRVRQRKRPKQDRTAEKTEKDNIAANTPVTTTRNLSSRLGQWNSKDTRSRLRQVAEKRLRANSLSSKSTTSVTSKGTTLKSTTVVESRGEEGLIGEGSEPEHTQIRTQTSRSIVMRRSRIKQQKEDFKRSHTPTKSETTHDKVEIAPTSPAGNRVTPEGVALVKFPKTAIALLLGLRDENVSKSSAVRRRAAGDVGAISTLSCVVSDLVGV